MGEGGYGNRGNDRDFARGSRRPPEASRSIPREEDHARDNPRISSHSNSFVIPNSKKRPADEDWFESGRFPNSKRYGPPLEGENPIANWGNKSWINPKLRAKERRASFSQSPQGRATSSLRDRRSSIDEAVNTPGEHDRGKIQDSHIAPAVPEPPNQSERHIVPEENLYKGQSPQYSDDVLPRMSSNNIVTKNGSMTAASLRLDPDLTNEVDQQRKGMMSPVILERFLPPSTFTNLIIALIFLLSSMTMSLRLIGDISFTFHSWSSLLILRRHTLKTLPIVLPHCYSQENLMFAWLTLCRQLPFAYRTRDGCSKTRTYRELGLVPIHFG